MIKHAQQHDDHVLCGGIKPDNISAPFSISNLIIFFFLFFFLLSINQIDECHISQDQTQKINFLRDPLLEDRFIHLFNKNTYNYFKVNKQNNI